MAFDPRFKMFKPALNLKQSEIAYVADKVYTNKEAALFLKISWDTWKKYAQLYQEPTTGLTYFDFLKQKQRPPRKKHGRDGVPMEEILSGNRPDYNPYVLKKRLIREGYKEECCEHCGFAERRISDYTVPLLLKWKDGDNSNHKLENLMFICYNCYFLMEGDRFGRKSTASLSNKMQKKLPDYEGY